MVAASQDPGVGLRVGGVFGVGLGAHHACLAHDGLMSALSLRGDWTLKTGGVSCHFSILI